VQFGIGIPQQFPDARIEPRRIASFLQRVEALGCFTSAWTSEQILGSMPSLDPLELMSFAAACTERLDLGCAVLLTPVRGPIHLAKSLATLDHLSQGRLIAGIGLGTKRYDAAFGIESETRVARFTEGLAVMKKLWTEPTVTHHGRFWQLHEVRMEPKPYSKPWPRLWLGAHEPRAVRRAAHVADGFIGAGSSPTSAFAEQVNVLRDALAEAGRSVESFPIAKRVYIAVDEDRSRASRRLEQWFSHSYGRSNHEQVAVWGSADECADKLREVHHAGASMIVLSQLFDHEDQLERFAADLLPRLRD